MHEAQTDTQTACKASFPVMETHTYAKTHEWGPCPNHSELPTKWVSRLVRLVMEVPGADEALAKSLPAIDIVGVMGDS